MQYFHTLLMLCIAFIPLITLHSSLIFLCIDFLEIKKNGNGSIDNIEGYILFCGFMKHLHGVNRISNDSITIGLYAFSRDLGW